MYMIAQHESAVHGHSHELQPASTTVSFPYGLKHMVVATESCATREHLTLAFHYQQHEVDVPLLQTINEVLDALLIVQA